MAKSLNKKFKLSHYINYIVVGIFTIVFGTLSLMDELKGSTLDILSNVGIAVILAVSLSVVVGFLGELSLGHAGFMCVGAYLGGKIAQIMDKQLKIENEWLMMLAALAVGGLAAAICGIVVGLPALRLKGDYLAIVTLAFGEIVRTLFNASSKKSFGGSLGLRSPRFDKNYLFIVAFVIILICLFVMQNLIRSKHGRAITAIRDNEVAAKATGINVTKYKLAVFTISSLFAGLAGVLYSFKYSTIQSTSFSYNYSIEILVMVVLGGMGSINGSIIAATLITYLNIKLQTLLTNDLAVLQNLIYALILIVIVIYNNAPALKDFRERVSVKNLIAKVFKPKHDPAHVHDDEAKWDRVPTKIEMNEVLSVDIQPQMSTVDPDKREGK